MRSDLDYFTRTMASLKKYKDHINHDVMSLLDRTSPLGLMTEELQASKVSSNSHASKRKRHEEYMRAVRMYNIEQDEILSLINICKMEQQKQAELDEENDTRYREEKDRLKQDELNAHPDLIQENNSEIKKYLESIKKLESEISKYLLIIEKHIAKIKEFVDELEEDIKEQRKQFLGQFYEDVKKILLSLCVQNGSHFEVHAGTQKIPIDLEKTAKTITAIMQRKFESHDVFDQKEFKASVQEVLVKTLFQSAYVPNEKIEKKAEKISKEIVKKQAGYCEVALRADQVQVQRAVWAKDLVAVSQQMELKLTHVDREVVSSPSISNLSKELESKMKLVNEIKQQVHELEKGIDFVKEERTNKALEAMRKLRMRSRAVDPSPAPSEENIMKPG